MPRGHKRRRGDAWELRVSAGTDPITGRRRVVTRTFRGTAKAADQALTKMLGELDQGAHRGPDATLGTLLDRWWSHSKNRWGPATTRGYLAYRRTYLADHEQRRLAEVTPEWLDALYAQLLAGRAPATIRKIHVMLHDALDDAVRWGWLAWNPADRAQPPPVKRKPLTVPSRVDVAAAIERIAVGDPTNTRDPGDPDYATLLHLQAVAGLRRAELAGLRWEDLDDDVLTVRRTIVEGPDGRHIVQHDTKTHRARRIILDPSTLAILEEHRLRWKTRCAEMGIDPGGYVFPRAHDPAVHMTPGQISQRWRRNRTKVGLADVRLHDFRHAMVTHLLDQGIPVHDVAARAGHANGNVTLSMYAHPTTEGARRAGDAAGL